MEQMSWIAAGEVAKLIGVAPTRVKSLAERGDIPVGIAVGGRTRWIRGDIESFVVQQFAEARARQAAALAAR